MLELTGMGSVLRWIGVLYWLLAIGAVALVLWKGKGWQGKTLWTAVAVAVFGFLPAKALIEQAQRDAYAREAWAYFKKKCETEAGEKIYKTFTGVKSVLVVKPLPPATEKDLYNQFWYGDPYSNATPWNKRDVTAADTLLRKLTLFNVETSGFDFVEIRRESNHTYVIERLSPNSTDSSTNRSSTHTQSASRFGVSWEDISTPEDRKYWIAASRLRVIDLANNSIVAERIGYLIEAGFGSAMGQRRPWLASRGPRTTCPSLKNGTYDDRIFLLSVLRSTKEGSDGK